MNYVLRLSVLTALVGIVTGIHPAIAAEVAPGNACMDDMKRLCGGVQPGGGAIRDCMKAHESEVSQACKDKRASEKMNREAKMKEMEKACEPDLKQFCADITPGDGRRISCLHAHGDKLSAACKASMPKHMSRKGHEGMKPHGMMGMEPEHK